jgi:hypothetical protein
MSHRHIQEPQNAPIHKSLESNDAAQTKALQPSAPMPPAPCLPELDSYDLRKLESKLIKSANRGKAKKAQTQANAPPTLLTE